MDLRLFHNPDSPGHNYKTADRFNSWTSRRSCRFLEWFGWYTGSIPLRLLGHYRLFQLYKKHRFHRTTDLPPVQGYILQYRSSSWIRYYFYLFISRLPALWGPPDSEVEMHAINQLLIHQRASILVEFLTNADTDFERAFNKALQQIRDPDFINTAANTKTDPSNLFIKLEQHNIHNNSHNELNIHPIVEREKETIVEKETTIKEIIIKEPAPPAKSLFGKEKDVFSKKQVLIFLDLLTQTSKLESLTQQSHAKYPAIAQFLQALTGKSADTWLETLKDYQQKDLYTCHTSTERSNLIATLTNLADICHKAGLRSVASLAEIKSRQLRAGK